MESFRVAVPQAELDDLHARLDRTRWPGELPGSGWDYGIPVGYLRDLADYWRHEYDWRAQERKLNEFPQFTTEIDGQRIHFVHLRSPRADALPLILTHGWPGSIAEFMKILEPLSADFHVVAPSLPGYGFSGPTTESGWEIGRVARAWAELMHRLGYRRYAAHGGDWGSAVSRELGRVDAEHVSQVHLTMILGQAGPAEDMELTAEERARLAQRDRYRTEYSGYMRIQSTRPQTLSYGLHDSPVGQLAWIAEKFFEWTDSADVPEDAVDRDQLLTNVSIYWFTGTAGSSARLYKESARNFGILSEPSPTPTSVAVFPKDLQLPIRRLAERNNNIVRWREYDRGGHFAAMEVPDLLVADLREALLDNAPATDAAGPNR